MLSQDMKVRRTATPEAQKKGSCSAPRSRFKAACIRLRELQTPHCFLYCPLSLFVDVRVCGVVQFEVKASVTKAAIWLGESVAESQEDWYYGKECARSCLSIQRSAVFAYPAVKELVEVEGLSRKKLEGEG